MFMIAGTGSVLSFSSPPGREQSSFFALFVFLVSRYSSDAMNGVRMEVRFDDGGARVGIQVS